MAIKTTLEWVDPKRLKSHPLNGQIYGDDAIGEFLERVKIAGHIIQPIAIVGRGAEYPELTIISGHRRQQAALKLKFDRVPVTVEHEAKLKDDIDELVILSNDQREKTNDQKRKEAEVLLEVERHRAEKRMKAGKLKYTLAQSALGSDDPSTKVVLGSDSVDGRALEIVSEKVGLSHNILAKALEVGEKIDALEDKGHTQKAEELREKLNENVSAAHREVKPRAPRQTKKPGTDKGMIIRKMKGLMSQVIKTLDARGKNGNYAKCDKAIEDFLEAWETWT